MIESIMIISLLTAVGVNVIVGFAIVGHWLYQELTGL